MMSILALVAGLAALLIALLPPLHHLGHASFAAHMIQHEVLMIIAAPLLVLSWRNRAWYRASPAAAWVVHAIALWSWHIPVLFQATLTSGLVHAAQHVSFLGASLLFWDTLIRRTSRESAGAGVFYLFTTALHTGLLGALLTFAPRPWYPAYAGAVNPFGLTALEDQQLGGLIMWVPASLVFVAGGLILFIAWLRESEHRAVRRERAAVA